MDGYHREGSGSLRAARILLKRCLGLSCSGHDPDGESGGKRCAAGTRAASSGIRARCRSDVSVWIVGASFGDGLRRGCERGTSGMLRILRNRTRRLDRGGCECKIFRRHMTGSLRANRIGDPMVSLATSLELGARTLIIIVGEELSKAFDLRIGSPVSELPRPMRGCATSVAFDPSVGTRCPCGRAWCKQRRPGGGSRQECDLQRRSSRDAYIDWSGAGVSLRGRARHCAARRSSETPRAPRRRYHLRGIVGSPRREEDRVTQIRSGVGCVPRIRQARKP